jgi:hypothetical protein
MKPINIFVGQNIKILGVQIIERCDRYHDLNVSGLNIMGSMCTRPLNYKNSNFCPEGTYLFCVVLKIKINYLPKHLLNFVSDKNSFLKGIN